MRSEVGSVESLRAGVVERLRAREGELVEAIFARVRGGVFAGSGDRDAEYLAGLRAAVVVAVEYGLEGVERGKEWVGPIPVAMVEQARRAAQAEVSLEVVLRRYVVGHTLLAEFVVEEVERGDLPAERSMLREVLRVLAVVLDRLLSAITREYEEERARVDRSPEQRRYERVRALLDGAAAGPSELDYGLEGWHLGVVAAGAGASPAVQALAAGSRRRLLSVEHGRERVWAWLGGRDRFAFADAERLLGDAALSEGVVLAVGEPGQGVEGWRVTHSQAQAALLVALREPGSPGVVRYADVALLAFALKDQTLAESLIEVFLAPLDRQRDGGVVLRETLRAYFTAGRSASSAAAALGVARNTVEGRLRTVEECLGRSLHSCLAELEMTLRLEELENVTAVHIAQPGDDLRKG